MEAVYHGRKTVKPEVKMKRMRNERGMALAMVLVFSVICLAVMAALIYMVTSRTRFSGAQKRYYSAFEAAKGGADILYEVIGAAAGGNTSDVKYSISNYLSQTGLSSGSLFSAVVTTPDSCTGTSMPQNGSVAYTGLPAKLKTATSSWNGCNTSVTITPPTPPATNTTYDIQFVFQGSSFPGFNTPTYGVYAKIIDTVEGGAIGSSTGLRTGGTTSQGGGGAGVHFLHTIEIDAENLSQPVGNRERAKFSVLLQY